MLSIDDIRALCHDETIRMTDHAINRCRERSIKYDEITAAILSGEIIEQYPEDFPYPSCLILGTVASGPLHVVAGVGGGALWIISAYRPALDKWEPDFKTRKAGQ